MERGCGREKGSVEAGKASFISSGSSRRLTGEVDRINLNEDISSAGSNGFLRGEDNTQPPRLYPLISGSLQHYFSFLLLKLPKKKPKAACYLHMPF